MAPVIGCNHYDPSQSGAAINLWGIPEPCPANEFASDALDRDAKIRGIPLPTAGSITRIPPRLTR
jgi:hypothetical protein